MANDYISQITLPDNETYDIQDAYAVRGNARIFYGTCDTTEGTALKEVICAEYDKNLTNGDMFIVKFTYTNTNTSYGDLKLTIKQSNTDTGTTAKNIKRQYNGTGANNLVTAAELNKDSIAVFIYNGTYWILTNADYNTTYSYMRPYESTGKGTYSSQGDNPAKTGSAGWKFSLDAGKYFMYSHYHNNTAKSALTLNIGNTGAKPIYINGNPSSASNYTLPGGQYLVYYDGTNYYFRTDNKMTGDITGDAATVNGLTVQTAVPTNAIFTDHYDWEDITSKPTTLSGYGITDAATSSHTHGNLTNDGKITSTATIANGDKLVIVDSDASSKIIGATITFDGTTETKALTPKGTWVTFNNYSHPTSAGNKHIPSGGAANQFLKYGGSSGTAVWSDLPVASTDTAGIIKIGTAATNAMAGNTVVNTVKQSPVPTSNNDEYPILLKTTANTNEETGTIKFSEPTITPKTGRLSATSFMVDSHVALQWNSTDSSLDFIFA